MNAIIESVASYVPSRRMSNDEIASLVDTSDEWIFSHTGIRYRHIAAPGESASDLGTEAARRALEAAALSPDTIDLVLLATSTPDYLGLPSTACVVQDRLGIPGAGSMDVMAACSGFIYAVETARAFVESGTSNRVLVIGSEVYSKIINWNDRATCVLFGDGAGAVVVARGEGDHGESRIGRALLVSRGSEAESLCRPAGGTRHPYIEGETPREQLLLSMNGRRIYNFAVKAVIDTINEILRREGLTFEEIDYVVPHQANARILEASAKRAGWDINKFFINIGEYANTSAASIPIALTEMEEKGLLARGMKLITVGFGAGLTYGGSLITW
ncbi:MAG: beta-ketoacyl-ACP synthase III [Alkalispirochaetaceae bacterium]